MEEDNIRMSPHWNCTSVVQARPLRLRKPAWRLQCQHCGTKRPTEPIIPGTHPAEEAPRQSRRAPRYVRLEDHRLAKAARPSEQIADMEVEARKIQGFLRNRVVTQDHTAGRPGREPEQNISAAGLTSNLEALTNIIFSNTLSAPAGETPLTDDHFDDADFEESTRTE